MNSGNSFLFSFSVFHLFHDHNSSSRPKAGVSIATVSRVVNGSTAVAPELRDRVLDAVSHCGYSPTVGRRSAASIALVYTGPFSVGSPYDAACLDGIVTAMLESDYDLNIVHLRRDKSASETYSQFFFRKGIRGAILRSTFATATSLG